MMVAQRVSLVRASETTDLKTVFRVDQVLKSKTYAAFKTEEEVREFFRKGDIFLIKLGEVLVGTTSFEPKEDESVYLANLAVLPEYQEKGFGTEAMHLLLGKVKRLGFEKATLVVHPENGASLHLCDRNGFKEVGRKDNYFGDGEPRLIFEKILE